MSISNCKLLDFPIITDPRGNLSFIEEENHISFKIKRVYYLYDVPGGAIRAGHAHKTLHQVLIAISGSFDIHLDDGMEKKSFHLNRSYYGLYIYPLTWRVIDNFSSGAVCLSIVSDFYDESDYFRDYNEFMDAIKQKK